MLDALIGGVLRLLVAGPRMIETLIGLAFASPVKTAVSIRQGLAIAAHGGHVGTVFMAAGATAAGSIAVRSVPASRGRRRIPGKSHTGDCGTDDFPVLVHGAFRWEVEVEVSIAVASAKHQCRAAS